MRSVYLIFRTYSLIVVSMFSILVVLMMLNLNEPKKKIEENQLKKAPGDIVVHIVWPNGNDDVDLWVTGPGEPVPVGYSNKGGVLWNLLRDDLGDRPDFTPINYEDAFTRGTPPGEYTINVSCWRCAIASLPMTVDVAVSIRDRKATGEPLENLARTKVLIKRNGEEKTAFSFTIKEDGKADPNSINTRFIPLRSAGGSAPPTSGENSMPYYGDR